MDDATSALLTDLYQLNMIQAYLDHGRTEVATFELFVRRLPSRRRFLMAAGLEQALDFLQDLRFSPDDLDWLARSGRFSQRMIDYLGALRFTGEVHAMPEGTVFFADEPILRVTAPLPQAQLVETRLINLVHFQTLVASKAARSVLAAPGKLLVDFGLRRAHGAEAGLMAARASFIAGFAGTATVLAGKQFDIPLYGTMAHSFVQSFDDEAAAFEAYAVSRPNGLTLLIDTYDTEAAARKVVALAPRLQRRGITIGAVRLDSGDLAVLSRAVRQILDDGGWPGIKVFASGGLDENQVAELVRAGAPIDGFGIGTSLTTSADAPTLDFVYKLEEYAGLARRKRSVGKETWPGRKQVWRQLGPDGRMASDILSLEDDRQDGEPLLELVMRDGRRAKPSPTLDDSKAHARRQLALLPESLTQLGSEPAAFQVEVADKLVQLTREVDSRTGAPDRVAG